MNMQEYFKQEMTSTSYHANPKYTSNGHPYGTFGKGRTTLDQGPHIQFISPIPTACENCLSYVSYSNPPSHNPYIPTYPINPNPLHPNHPF